MTWAARIASLKRGGGSTSSDWPVNPPTAPKIAVFGNSMSARGVRADFSTPSYQAITTLTGGWLPWWQALMEDHIDLELTYMGTTANRYDGLKGRVFAADGTQLLDPSDFVALDGRSPAAGSNPGCDAQVAEALASGLQFDIAIFLASTIDIAGNASAATIVSRYQTLIAPLIAAGKKVIIVTDPHREYAWQTVGNPGYHPDGISVGGNPTQSVGAGNTTKRAVTTALANLLVSTFASDVNVKVVNTLPATTDPSKTNPADQTYDRATNDGLHMAPVMAMRLAKAVYDAVRSFFPAGRRKRHASTSDAFNAASAPLGYVNGNPFLTGSAGTTVGTTTGLTATGAIPTGLRMGRGGETLGPVLSTCVMTLEASTLFAGVPGAQRIKLVITSPGDVAAGGNEGWFVQLSAGSTIPWPKDSGGVNPAGPYARTYAHVSWDGNGPITGLVTRHALYAGSTVVTLNEGLANQPPTAAAGSYFATTHTGTVNTALRKTRLPNIPFDGVIGTQPNIVPATATFARGGVYVSLDSTFAGVATVYIDGIFTHPVAAPAY